MFSQSHFILLLIAFAAIITAAPITSKVATNLPPQIQTPENRPTSNIHKNNGARLKKRQFGFGYAIRSAVNAAHTGVSRGKYAEGIQDTVDKIGNAAKSIWKWITKKPELKKENIKYDDKGESIGNDMNEDGEIDWTEDYDGDIGGMS